MSYTITEEQIKSIAEGGGKKKIKEMFPQVFGNKIEVGKWYKMKEVNNRCIFYVSRINGDKMFGYGLSYSGYWFNHNEKANGHIGNPKCNNLYFLATDEEVETALIAELVKRYGVDWQNVKLENHADSKLKIFLNIQNYNVEIAVDYGTIWNKNGVIFYNGVFAEILQEKTLSKSEAKCEDSIFPPITELTAKEDKEKYPNSLFWFHGDIFILELEKTDDKLIAWVNYYKIWNPISQENNWDSYQTQAFLKVRIEEHFKLRDVTPILTRRMLNGKIEEHFKLRDVTPESSAKSELIQIEEHFKLRDVTPQKENDHRN